MCLRVWSSSESIDWKGASSLSAECTQMKNGQLNLEAFIAESALKTSILCAKSSSGVMKRRFLAYGYLQ